LRVAADRSEREQESDSAEKLPMGVWLLAALRDDAPQPCAHGPLSLFFDPLLYAEILVEKGKLWQEGFLQVRIAVETAFLDHVRGLWEMGLPWDRLLR
jgi:hypothetical protein